MALDYTVGSLEGLTDRWSWSVGLGLGGGVYLLVGELMLCIPTIDEIIHFILFQIGVEMQSKLPM